MGFTTVAFTASFLGTDQELTPIADEHVRIEGNNLVVPSYNLGLLVLGVGANLTGMKISAPSQRGLALPQVHPFERNATPRFPLRIFDRTNAPIVFDRNEQLKVLASTDGASASRVYSVLWLGDRQPSPVSGRVFTVRATGSTTLTANAWTPVSITLDQQLPAGRYALVGLAARSAGLIAARVVFIGGIWRPGVPGIIGQGDDTYYLFRNGNMGVFGEFEHNLLPTIQCLSSSADTSEEFYLDLIKVA